MTTPTPPVTTPEALAGLLAALQRIRDDYGDLWGGSITLREQGETIPRLCCMWCGEWAAMAAGYQDIAHDEDCPVFIASAALDAHLFPGRAAEKGEPTR